MPYRVINIYYSVTCYTNHINSTRIQSIASMALMVFSDVYDTKSMTGVIHICPGYSSLSTGVQYLPCQPVAVTLDSQLEIFIEHITDKTQRSALCGGWDMDWKIQRRTWKNVKHWMFGCLEGQTATFII